MRKRSEPAKTKPAPTTPINFRMPASLRTRLRRYAATRHLSESEALRVALSERLDEVDSTAELASAERWQYEQAYATWDRFRRGEGRTVARERIDQVFRNALADAPEDTRRGR